MSYFPDKDVEFGRFDLPQGIRMSNLACDAKIVKTGKETYNHVLWIAGGIKQ